MISNTKKCTRCGVTYPIEGFFKTGRTKAGKAKYRGDCKGCAKKDTANWRVKNKSHYNNYAAMYRAKHPEAQHEMEIKRRYGISIEHYNQMLVAQNMGCAICRKQHDSSISRGRLYVDHDHKTGAVRALLCGGCNSMLGYASDSIEILQKAIAYLSKK